MFTELNRTAEKTEVLDSDAARNRDEHLAHRSDLLRSHRKVRTRELSAISNDSAVHARMLLIHSRQHRKRLHRGVIEEECDNNEDAAIRLPEHLGRHVHFNRWHDLSHCVRHLHAAFDEKYYQGERHVCAMKTAFVYLPARFRTSPSSEKAS